MTTAFVPEYIAQEALLRPEVKFALDQANVPEDQRHALVRTITHAVAPNIIIANRQRG